MKVAALGAVALILCISFPGPIQAKQKSPFCVGKDGKKYAVGDSYVDNKGQSCIRYKCAKKKKTFIMKKENCDCNGGNHGIPCCPNYVRGDMVGGSEINITFSPNTENGCQNSCKIQHPTSIGVTQDHDGTSSCYCEFGSPIVGGSANEYKTCLFSTATSGILKTIKRITTTTTAPTTRSTTTTSTTISKSDYGSCGVEMCLSLKGCHLVRNNLMTTLTELKKEFYISFEFIATEYGSWWQNVIHLTVNGDTPGSPGRRMPGIWVLGAGKLGIWFPENGKEHDYLSQDEYPVGQWRHMEFSQTLENNTYMYRVKLNGQIIIEIENSQPKVFHNVKVYAADPWWSTLKGSLRNLLINTEGSNKCKGTTTTSATIATTTSSITTTTKLTTRETTTTSATIATTTSTITTTTKSTTTGPCASGWTSLETGCYMHVQADSFPEAMSNCKKQGGYLVEIDSQEEQDAMFQFSQKSTSKTKIMVGGTDEEKEGEWKGKHTEQIMKYTAWHGSEPGGKTAENCIIAYPQDQLKWHDYPCSMNFNDAAAMCEQSSISNPGFNMSATCDDVMWLFADGDLLVKNSSDWRVTSEVHIPPCTKVIEIHCLDSWIHGGILASSDNGLITDGAWNCSSDNGTTWNPAYLLGRNGRTAPDISSEAIWIWTDMSHWMQTDHRRHTKAICKIDLETSQCPEPPVCPPFGELTPTTILTPTSTPTPAPTTTTTTSKPKPGFNMTATCDNKMKLFVDGNLLATSSNWRDTSKVNIPANTEAIEIHCMDTGTVGGILASSDNGLLTDGSWNCSSDNGTTWNAAYEAGPNSGAIPDISPDAEWIWTGCIGDWTSKYTGKKHQKNVICKIDLKPIIDGGWSEWSAFSPCSATCGDSTKTRTRTCSNPPPRNGGEPCLGLEEEVVSCGVVPCGGDSCSYTDKYLDCPQWKTHCESGEWEQCVNENCPKTCKCTGSDSVYFLAGGNLHDVKYEIELYHPTMKNLSCSITVPSLDDRTWHTTFYFSNTVYLCGGYNTESTCISYNTNMNGWKTHALTTSRKKEHTSVVLNNRLYLIGGHNSSNTGRYLDSESTPLPLTDQPVLTPVPNLNYKLGPCTAKVDEDTLVVTGGYYSYGYLSTAIQYNVKTSTYTSLPSQKQSRSRHGCVVVKMKNTKWIIVSGGYGIKGNVGSPLQSTEMLQLGGRSWIQLGNLNEARQVHSMVATVRGILVMGGEGANGKDLSTVELLDLSIKQWSVIEPSLKTPRLAFGGAVEIPARMFDCTDTTSTTSSTNVTTTTTTTSTIVPCPIGWTALQTGCYRFVEASTFNLAITRCEEKGGFTAELKSQNEQDAFSQFMKDSGFSKKNVWLGASLVGNEWIWFHSKQKMTFSAWGPGSPSGGGETCVAAWGMDDTTLWNDVTCYGYGTMALCQYSPVPE